MEIEKILVTCNFDVLLEKLKNLRDESLSSDVSSLQITKSLTNEISRYFAALGFKVIPEVLVEAPYKSNKRGEYVRSGRVDLLIVSKAGWQLAIEIDRGNKKWSAEKLKQLQNTRPDTIGIWIRWKGQMNDIDTSRFVLVDLNEEKYKIFFPNSQKVSIV